MNSLIKQLHHRNLLWYASNRIQTEQIEKHQTGFTVLDEKLAGGMPTNGVIELLSSPGIGELRLIAPSFKMRQSRFIVFISPPALVNSAALHHLGVDVSQVLVLYPEQHKDALWAVEQCLQSGSCSDVIYWPQQDLTISHIQRFQQASKSGKNRLFYLNSYKTSQASLPVTLSLTLQAHPQGLKVKINRRKGGWPSDYFIVDMQTTWPYCTIASSPISNVIAFPVDKAG